MSADTRRVIIFGAGPAGLTAAYELAKRGVTSTVLEKDRVVGGLSRTERYKGYLFDIGGHRFFTKVGEVEAMWREVLGEDLLRVRRLSRIYYRNRFFHYPLKPANAFLGLGPWRSLLVLLSYARARLFPIRDERSFEDWVINRFGRRLYRTFFETYTEKVWGIPCRRISADWAAQRIKGLSLGTALKRAFRGARADRGEPVVKSLIESFQYPALGPGMMWEKVASQVRSAGVELRLETEVERIDWAGDRIRAVHVAGQRGTEILGGTHFVSSMPIRELVERLHPAPPRAVARAAARLRYRDFLTVVLIVDREALFPDHWIYIHDPGVQVGRVQNFKNWSPRMVPDPRKTCLGLEYFCREGDGLWESDDAALIALGKREMERLGLLRAEEVEDAAVVRMPKAYPVHDDGYAAALGVVREFLATLSNLQLVGRNGMHKYNNQDHSMLTAMLAARNILGAGLDLWAVNVDSDYLEEVTLPPAHSQASLLHATQPLVPATVSEDDSGSEVGRP